MWENKLKEMGEEGPGDIPGREFQSFLPALGPGVVS